jgi:hypothetical protein
MSQGKHGSELTDLQKTIVEILDRGERISDVAAALGIPMTEAQRCGRGALAKLIPEPWASLSDRLDEILEDDHPHGEDLLEGDRLLAHLRFRHGRGRPRYHAVEPGALPNVHRRLHHGSRDSYA